MISGCRASGRGGYCRASSVGIDDRAEPAADPRSSSLPGQESCIRRDDLAKAQASEAEGNRPITGRVSVATG
jgi:hypothetical protein